MTASTMSQLQDLASSLSSEDSKEEGIAKLTKACELFSNETLRLEKAYSSLKTRFDAVNLELERTNKSLSGKVLELDMMTEYLGNIVENMSQGLLFIGEKGVITTCNEAAEHILMIDKKDVILKTFWDVFDDAFFGFSMRNGLKYKGVPHAFVAMVPSGDEKREIEVTTKYVEKDLATHRGIIILIRDITEIRRLQCVSRRNDRMKELGEMAASVAHEIRNPLGGIEGFASLLYRDFEGDEYRQNMAHNIVEGSRTVNALITKVLNYSRPLNMNYESVDIVAFMRDIIDFLKVDSAFSHIREVVFEEIEEEVLLSIDPLMFKSVFFNLLLNAAQAMQEGGDVMIRMRKEEKQVVIEIEDTGCGISRENLEKIFSPFFTTKHEGNGFGLSEVYKVIQAHGGDIEVDSEEGKGSIFVVTLPFVAQHMKE